MNFYDLMLAESIGGSGGDGITSTDAILRVQAPAGSTVTISKGTTEKTDDGHENASDNTTYDYYFIIHQSQFDSNNAWTVTATLGADTTSSTVIIDSSDEYDVILSFRIPGIYQEVEYLESTGTQFIKTNYIIPADAVIEFGGKLTEAVNDNTFFGVTSTNSNRCLSCGLSTGKIRYLYGNNSYKDTSTTFTSVDAEVVIGQTFVVNNSNIGSVSVPAQTLPIYVFAENDKGGTARKGKVRIKYFKVKSDDTLEIELVPVYRKSDSVAGMYDTVGKVFYTNDGTGTFTVGGDVQ